MSRTNKAKESRVKARRTSLEKKSVEELVNIILRKDGTEQANSRKINTLKDANEALTLKNDELQEKINVGIGPLEETIEVYKDKNTTLNESLAERNILISELNSKVERFKGLATFRRKAIYVLFIIYVITVVLLSIKCCI